MNSSLLLPTSTRPLRAAKFGGSVMANERDVMKSIGIAARRGYDLSVVSALSGSTQKLIECTEEALRGIYSNARMSSTPKSSHFLEFKKLNDSVHRDADTEHLHAQLHQALHFLSTHRDSLSVQSQLQLKAHVLSFGELLSALIFSKRSGFTLLRPEDIAFTISGADPTSAKPVGNQITPAHLQGNQVVFPGYYGLIEREAAPSIRGWRGGELFGVMGRGASDLTLACLVRTLYDSGHYAPDDVKIFYCKNVAFFKTADPYVFKAARNLHHMSYFEVASLDSKILDPRSAQELDGTGIVSYIVPFKRPHQLGTRIASTKPEGANGFSISHKARSKLTVKDANMLGAVGFLSALVDVLQTARIVIDDSITTNITINLTVDRSDGPRALSALRQVGFDPQFEPDVTVVSVVTDLLHLAKLDHVMSDVLGQLDIHSLMRTQTQGGEPRVLVMERDAVRLIRALHKRLLKHL